MATSVTCPGCRLALPAHNLPLPARFLASGECQQLYHELTFYTLTHGDVSFIHQTAVDAYAAQHTGAVSKPITTVFALVGLYLSVEHGYTGRQVQLAHMQLAQQFKHWPQLAPPPVPAHLSVLDVLLADAGPDRDAALAQWAAAIWKSWEQQQVYIRQVAAQYLPLP
ncbi:MAG: serine/threonine protein kinase [Hymenobacter sp.]|nr:serine/threonine protein kinase [Hymenobacter sp.]